MATVQSTYTDTMPPAFAGMIANHEPWRCISRTLQSPAMAFGVPAMQGTTDNSVLIAGASGAGGFTGIAVVDPTLRAVDNNAYAQYDTVCVLITGTVWVIAAVAVTPRQTVYYDAAGNFTNVATGNTAVLGGMWDSTAASGKLAKIRIR